jgi:polyisoprenoid-binding protein YceI
MKKYLFLTCLLFISTLAFAAEWKSDRAHSSVLFTIKHLVISEVTGRFGDFDIKVNSFRDDFSDMTVEATLKVNSINTEVERRDNDLKSDNFFNAERFPEIRFRSTRVEKIGENQYKIHGDLSIRDITKPVSFDAVHNGTLRSAKGTRAGWKATLAINRFDYGLKWNQLTEAGGLVAGDMVNITVNLEITR